MELVNKWINDNYTNIIDWSKNACQGKSDYEDVAHYAITIFLEHNKAEELVMKGHARWFIVRIMLNSSRGKKSAYYRTYRPKHDSLSEHTTDTPDTLYNHDIDSLTETISGILEDLKHGDPDQWFLATVFELCMKEPKLNFSKVARDTKIPRTSIANAYYQTIEFVKIKLEEYGYNINDLRSSDLWNDNTSH